MGDTGDGGDGAQRGGLAALTDRFIRTVLDDVAGDLDRSHWRTIAAAYEREQEAVSRDEVAAAFGARMFRTADTRFLLRDTNLLDASARAG